MTDHTLIIILCAAAGMTALLSLVTLILVLAKSASLRSKQEEDAKRRAEIVPLLFGRLDSTAESQLSSQREISAVLRDLTEKNYAESRRSAELLRSELDKIRQTVDEKLNETLTSRLDASFRTVSEQLENVYRSMGEMKELSVSVTDNVSGLNRILSNVKARGTWGEAQLKNILDDIVPTLYEVNVATNPESPQKRVEFAVRMSAGKDSTMYLPIDSKFPLEDYARLCEAAESGDAAAMQEARKQLKQRVLNEAKEVTKYIHEPETAPFAVLYLATEGLYAEAASDEALVARVRSDHRVLLCGPSTIAALLNSLALGMRTVEINRKAEEIRQLLAAVRDQYNKFTTQLAKVRKKLGEAESALDEAEKSGRKINKKLSSAELGDAAAAEPEPELLESFETEEDLRSYEP
ncbi:MAG: DNA recombination protein RmuC [Clostridia bacterium]|nr:DNA recombination protein RmuC [Clostridia bacterium]